MTAHKTHPRTILVMGLPRSGTTWLGKIFDSHPDTFYSHEPDSAAPLKDVPLLLPVEAAEEFRERLLSGSERLQRVRTSRVVGKLPLFGKNDLSGLPVWLRAKELLVLKSLSRAIGDLNVPRHVAGSPDRARYWIWKSIESTGRLGALLRVLPESKAVFIVRHPCGVASSVIRGENSTKFSAGPSSADHGFFSLLAEAKQAQSRGLTTERFLTMSPVERMAWRWGLLNEKTLDDTAGLSNCRLVRYEDLCQRPMEIARELFEFAGLSWHAQTEQFVSRSTAREDSSYYGVFKNPAQSANKWKKELATPIAEEILRIAAQTKPGELFSLRSGFGPIVTR